MSEGLTRKKLEQVRRCAVGSDWNGLKEVLDEQNRK